jgi:hypothetical protein
MAMKNKDEKKNYKNINNNKIKNLFFFDILF